jgi:two-component system, NtrC family, sensor kinase
MMDLEEEARYMRFQPIYFEDSCMPCHGDPADAPIELSTFMALTGGLGNSRGVGRGYSGGRSG